MKRINIILIIVLIIFTSVSICFTSYGTNEIPNTENDDRKNNNLQSLLIEGYELYPEFNKNILTYYVVIPFETNSLNITAETENENSTIKIVGNTNLNRTENTIKITVTAPNKTSKTYNIIATKQKENDLVLTSLFIEGSDLSSNFNGLNYNYTFDYKSNKDVIDLNVEATPNVESATVEIIGNKGLEAGENLVSIILRNGDTTTIYQILVNISVEKVTITEVASDSFLENLKTGIVDFFKDLNKVIALLCVFAIFLVILIIAVIIKLVKNKRANKNRERLVKRVK